MLAINSLMTILMSCNIIVAYGTFWLKHKTTIYQIFKIFQGATFVFFSYHDISYNFSRIYFTLGGFIFT